MVERTLKDLANRHFEVMWRYENMTNSIIVRLKKRLYCQWYELEQKIGFEDLKTSNIPLFEFCMVQILKGMAQEIDRMTTEASMKGENHD
ncbi:hypothetical protein [Ruthenibacterium lactatiformans]